MPFLAPFTAFLVLSRRIRIFGWSLIVNCKEALERRVRIRSFLQAPRGVLGFSRCLYQVLGFIVFFLRWHEMLNPRP